MKKRNRQTATLSVTILLLTAAISSAEQTAAAEAAARLEAASTTEPIVRGTIVETKEEQVDEKIIEETGIYTGLADPHTAEIKIDGEAASFQLEDDGLMEQLEQWRSGMQVQLKYSVKTFDELPDVKQLILHDIKLSDTEQ
ncbi:hypothetical protein M3231_22375 [Neobacillus mesonae]|nr:hypothetical protein [Neobacillus mesonae]